MKLKKNDKVLIIAGKDRDKQGKILRVELKNNKIVIEGINIVKKHQRPKRQGEKGQIVEIPKPLDISNVKLICPNCGQPTKVGYKVKENKKSRICKNCEQEV